MLSRFMQVDQASSWLHSQYTDEKAQVALEGHFPFLVSLLSLCIRS